MDRQSKRHPDIPVSHPGEALREIHFPAIKRSLEQIAADIDVPPGELEALLAEQHPITAELALKLARYLGGSAELWVKLQASHDLWKARQSVDVSHIERGERVEAAE